MEKNTIKYILDVILGIVFLIVVFTGIFKFSGFREFLGITLSYNDPPMPLISWFHDWSGIVMAVIVLVHLILNWDWIVSMTKSFFVKDEEAKIGEAVKKGEIECKIKK
tara:strand:+ start:5130 stop:5453 length:324 start_codon:yes stop_codon:yes gene_type:complete